MKKNKRKSMLILNTVFLFFYLGNVIAGEKKNQMVEKLQPFAKLINSEWHSEGSYHTLEWGVGQQSIISKSYFVVDSIPQLVAEGVWFYHPGVKKIKGYTTAINMPFSLLDMTISLDGAIIENYLISYSANGKDKDYVETWEFSDDDHYIWTLYSITPDGRNKIMSNSYERKNK